MIQLIITADDGLYEQLAGRAQSEGDAPDRASNAIEGLEKAALLHNVRGGAIILLDMALRSADTLLETLNCRPKISSIPRLAVVAGGYLPFHLRRLCTGLIDKDEFKAR
ncbi:MAG: hypothetical protein JXA42_03360 [Anaerolineales bacterium]|nr:hypothetical protein [Anaerolineales bacterium]